jgi:signal transduction histidine kinase
LDINLKLRWINKIKDISKIKHIIKTKMQKKSITKKLFIITTAMFAVFIAGTLIIQSLFFERLYINKKENELTGYAGNFRSEYNKAQSNTAALEVLEDYELSYNIKILIMDKNYDIKGLKNTKKGRNDGAKVAELSDFIRKWVAQGESNNSKIYSMNNRETGTRTIIAVLPNISKEEIIFVSSSLQPVNEAVSVIEKIYLYFSIGAIFVTILLAFVYSRMIAKPLLKINEAATKMAQLDFTEKCEVVSEDEIGNVAASLNFLSENLSEAMTSLRAVNAQLEKDIEKERVLERMRKEFVASVSHELKTPISLIDGYAIGLKDEIFEDEDKDYYLDVIIDEAKKMGHLVSDMLDLSHLESGLFKLKKEEFDITELIEFSLRKYKGNLEERNITLETKLIDDVLVYADWNRMEQVITNFITNAIRHVDDNGSIYVSMVDKEDSIAVEIENTGSSIEEDELIKIWDKFYKIDKSRNRKLGGTGIGLSIVKNILELHGYSYGVSNIDRGVKFYFTITK